MPTIPERLIAIETIQVNMLGVLNKIDKNINGNGQPGILQNYTELKGKVNSSCDILTEIQEERKEEVKDRNKQVLSIKLLVVGQLLMLASAVALDFFRSR